MKSISIGTKIGVAVCIFLIPISMLAYYVYDQKKQLIDFTQKEIRGMQYLSAAQQVVFAVSNPDRTADSMASAAKMLSDAETHDFGSLLLSEQSAELLALLHAEPSTKPQLLIEKATALISMIADNSNITLDPDGDTYFVGDVSVNQAMSTLLKARSIQMAAHDLDSDPSNSTMLAYAKARDGLAISAANLETSLSKAFKNNADGTLKAELKNEAQALYSGIAHVLAAADSGNRQALSDNMDDLMPLWQSFVAKNNQSMLRLLNARIEGYRAVMRHHLGASAIATLLGMLAFWLIIRALLKAEATRIKEAQRRSDYVRELTSTFEMKAQHIASTVAAASTELAQTAELMTDTAHKTSKDAQSAAVSATTVNDSIQVIAAAVEEMAIASREISQQVIEANRLAHSSKEETDAADSETTALVDATRMVNETVALISNIAGQINLLALNATIESARAGEAGRGFAVVASEVKNLADQTNNSAADVSKIIAKVDEASSTIVAMLGRIKDSVINTSGASASMAAAVEEQSVTTHEITRNMQVVARGAEEIASKLHHVSESTTQSASSASQVLIAAQELSCQSESLNSEVVEFLAAIRAA